MRLFPAQTAALLSATMFAATACAQIGSVKTEGLEIAGNVTLRDGRAAIGNNAAVTTGLQAADVTLARGGTLKVCAGSSAHVSASNAAVKRPPLMVAVDRGTVELKTGAEKTDAILTPDLRMELSDGAPLDLRIRVVPNGDTCVDNAGKDAPVLHVTETFGSGAYFIKPGQRVLFEHGSLREVVDHEPSSCGCPKAEPVVLAGKGKLGDGKVTEAAKAHPFPEAVSQGLTGAEVPQAAPGEVHAQVNSTLAYAGTTNTVTGPPGASTTASPDGASGATSGVPATAPVAETRPAAVAVAPAPPPTNVHVESSAPPPAGPNPFRAIGRFFRRLFGVHD